MSTIFTPLYQTHRFMGLRIKCVCAEMQWDKENVDCFQSRATIRVARDDAQPLIGTALALFKREIEDRFHIDHVIIEQAQTVEILVDVLLNAFVTELEGPPLADVLHAYATSIEIGGYVDRHALRTLLQTIYGTNLGVMLTVKTDADLGLLNRDHDVQLQCHQVAKLIPGNVGT